MDVKVKKIVMYSIDLEPLSEDNFKCLMEQYVANRISTNSIFVYESFEEKNIGEWYDEIEFNIIDKQLEACKKLFNDKK